jgi:hypothetical protein
MKHIYDPATKAIMENMKIPPEKIRETADMVISIKVTGTKPNETS